MKETLKEKIKQLPNKPGVYVFKNSAGKIIYIGKALSLKPRVSSYFQNKHHDSKTVELAENIADLQTIVVNSEFEALLLEAKLIKQHKPKYNFAAKDGKSYLYIVIDKQFPNRIYQSRKPELENNLLDWYGPFPSGREVREILKYIRRIFPYRSCKKLPKTPCLYFHLKLCPEVCQHDIEIDYQKTIVRIRQILSGKISNLINSLEKEMKILAKNNRFEEAQKNKYQHNALKRLTEGWKSVPKEYQDYSKAQEELKNILIKHGGINQIAINKIEGYDVSNLGNQIIVGSMVAFVNGEPDKSQYRKFNLKFNLNFQDDTEGIRQIVRRRLNHPEWILPQFILIDGGKTQISAAFQALKEKSLENQIAVLGLIKGEEIIIVPQIIHSSIRSWKRINLPRNSQVLRLFQRLRDESHRFAQKYYKSLHRKKLLKL